MSDTDAALFVSPETMLLAESAEKTFADKAKLFNKWAHTRKTHIYFREFLSLFETYDTLAEIGRVLKVSRQVVSVYYEKYRVGDFFSGCPTGASWQKNRFLLKREEESQKVPLYGVARNFFEAAKEKGIDVRQMWARNPKDRKLLQRNLFIKSQNGKKFKLCYLQYWWKYPLRGYDKLNHYRSDIAFSRIKDCDFLILILKSENGARDKYFMVPVNALLRKKNSKGKIYLYLSNSKSFGYWKQFEEAWHFI